MPDILLRKHLRTLVPVDGPGQEMLAGISQNEIVKAKISRPRNVQHHRKFFALLKLVFENQEKYVSPDELLAGVKIAVGHVDVIDVAGVLYRIPKSIAFHKMDQTEFDRFYAAVVDVVLKHFLPGVTRDELRQELLEFAA